MVLLASYLGNRVIWRGSSMAAVTKGRESRAWLRRISLGKKVSLGKTWPALSGYQSAMMKTLFLQPPSFDGFDGGAGSRYQARREIKSFWYPTWLAQPAALVPGSKLIDAPPARIGMAPILEDVKNRDLVVIHTSTPSFANDVKVAAELKDANPALKIGFVGAKVAVQPAESLSGGPAIDFVARNEFDFTIKEIAEGRDWADVDGISYRDADGVILHNKDRAMLEDMDQLPFVTEVYKRDLRIEDYFIGYLMHPYVSLYTGPRLQIALHLLPVAADGRRPSLPRAQPRACGRGNPPGEGGLPAGAGILLRRRHLHRQSAARRGDRPRTGQARRHLVLQRQGERAARDAGGAEG